VYLGDLLYSFPLGSDLTGWTLGGNTVPTIAADGQIDIYDAVNLANARSVCTYTIPNSAGQFYGIVHFKLTRQNDDTSFDDYSLVVQISSSTVFSIEGLSYKFNSAGPSAGLYWSNRSGGGGTSLAIAFTPVIGTECEIVLLITPTHVIILANGILQGRVPIGQTGTCLLSETQIKSWCEANKVIYINARHQAGQVSHYRIRDIRVSAYRGTSV
jgi:hypothetical protein